MFAESICLSILHAVNLLSMYLELAGLNKLNISNN